MTIGEYIKKIRQEKGLSQRELGEKLGVSQQMIGQYENSGNTLKYITVYKILAALDVSITELMDIPMFFAKSQNGIGENIKRLRKEKGLNPSQLGKLCQPPIDEANIRKYETGKQLPELETLKKIAKALKIDIGELIENEVIILNSDIRDEYIDFDNQERHHLLTHHYNALGRIGRNSLIEILYNLKILNSIGQKEASKRVAELTEIPRYTEPDTPPEE